MNMFKTKKNDKQLTENEVLEKLNIPDFRHITKDKIMSFTSLLNQMDPEVAKTALQQFPEFAQMSSQVIACYKDIVTATIKSNDESAKSFMKSCDDVIEILKPLVNEKIPNNEKQEIIKTIMDILRMKQEKDTENKEWLGKLIKTVGVAVVSLTAIVGTVIGVNLKK